MKFFAVFKDHLFALKELCTPGLYSLIRMIEHKNGNSIYRFVNKLLHCVNMMYRIRKLL